MLVRANKTQLVAAAFSMLLLLPSAATRAASVGQLDDFGDGTLQGWQMGDNLATDTFMHNISSGGPNGAGDSYLEVSARIPQQGEPNAGRRLTFFNRQQWTGNYTAAGITAIAMDLKNFSTAEILNMRLAISGGNGIFSTQLTGGVFISNSISTLNVGGGWTRAVFSLLPSDLTAIGADDLGRGNFTPGNDVAATLANVLELRLLNSATDSWTGLTVNATVGVDNIQAVPLPPAIALFGSALALLLGQRKRSLRK